MTIDGTMDGDLCLRSSQRSFGVVGRVYTTSSRPAPSPGNWSNSSSRPGLVDIAQAFIDPLRSV
ncbi:MAG: hypothetical protein ACRBN8_27505 [Nannocystales bacterium]